MTKMNRIAEHENFAPHRNISVRCEILVLSNTIHLSLYLSQRYCICPCIFSKGTGTGQVMYRGIFARAARRRLHHATVHMDAPSACPSLTDLDKKGSNGRDPPQ